VGKTVKVKVEVERNVFLLGGSKRSPKVGKGIGTGERGICPCLEYSNMEKKGKGGAKRGISIWGGAGKETVLVGAAFSVNKRKEY